MDNMSINWKEWNIGGKLIFVSSIIAVLSFLLPWIDIGIASRSGFSVLGFVLIIFFIYPVLCLLKNNEISRIYGFISSGLAVLSGISWIINNQNEFMGESINTSGSGLYLFAISSIILIIGVWKYEKTLYGDLENN
tara:strand:- start:270 stop:677 length:408 start_codon:yes stop_codon:yes gene_type:complete